MRLSSLLAKEEGTATIIFALALVAVLGCTALVIDVGLVMVEKHTLQNAVDATALAAAQDLPDTSTATETAHKYIQENGYSPSDISLTFSNSNRRIDVDAAKTVRYHFARVLGFDAVTLHPGASAERSSIGGAFDYALFSGSTSTPLSLYCSQFYIGGSTHTNHEFTTSCSTATITGACEATSTITIYGSSGGINIPTRISNAPVVEMPDFSETAKSQILETAQVYNGNKTFNGNSAHFDSPVCIYGNAEFNVSSVKFDGPVYVDGNITFNCSNFSGDGIILAKGNITFNTSSLKIVGDNPVCFYSINGNITVSASSVRLEGIVYAPKGAINFYVSSVDVDGRVIGNKVNSSASNIRVVAGTKELEILPNSGGIKLVR